ncbi:unnamed protein product [Mytilus coruscus]|uniref:SMB domain-containing protein n=1 Tax=Mytilus coruscus TaxID=42192 RepID=A0A6J8D271_MYTCO|nr:unnamed protein product [Mytilus coruscus]
MHTTTCKSQPNYEKIYNHYAATCGLHFCDASMISLKYFQNNLTNLGSVCPACHCNDCILNTNCCPDFGLLHHREKCMNDVIYNPYNLLSDVYFSVIDKCPPNTPPKIRNICEKETDLIQNLTLVPVTSQNRTTYRNVYCGQCHGETDLEPWTIDINCQKFADFNFLSSFEEIAETIKVKMCTVRYVQQNANNKALPCNRVTDNLIGRCNMTGTWSSYDMDIDWACDHFQLPFDKYKSIFCLMCNPPLPDLYMDIVSTCNITDDSTKVLENACEMYQQSNVTFPFKNIFCYLCNRYDDKDKYNDINGYVSTLFEGDRMVYRMEQLMFRNDFLTPYLSYQSDKPNTDFKLGNRLNSSYEFFDDGRQVNVANLMTLYSLAYGPNLCGIYNTGPKTLVPYCSCHETCISHHTCCVDFELDQLLDCLDGNTVSGICRYTDEGMNSSCEKRGELMYDLPVSRTDTKNHYKNIFCALCADNKFNFPMRFPVKPFAQDFFHPWDIEITCAISNPLPIYYQLSMTDIFKSATRRNCDIKFKPARGKAALCDDKTIMINSCNVSGTWSHLDADVLWACEKLNTTFMTNFRGFRNVFCTLCNPGVPLQPIPPPTTTTETINRVPGICISCISSAGVVTTFRALF